MGKQRNTGNTEVAEQLWNAIATADIEALRAVIAPNAVWTMPGESPVAGRYEGIDAILGFMALTGELAEELSSQLVDVFTGKRGVILRYAVQARRGEHFLETEHLFLIRIEDGQIVEGTFAPIDQHRYDRFWAAAPDSYGSDAEKPERIRSESAKVVTLNLPSA